VTISDEEFEKYQMFQWFQAAEMMPSSTSTQAHTNNSTACLTFAATRTWIIDSEPPNI